MSVVATVRRTFGLLTGPERREGAFLVLTLAGAALAEFASVAAIYPFLAVLADPAIVARDARIAWLHEAFGSADLEGFVLQLGALALGVTIVANLIVGATLWWQVRYVWRVNHSLSQRLLARHLSRPYLDFVSRNSSAYVKQVLDETQTLVLNTVDPALTMLGRLSTTITIGALLLLVAPGPTLVLLLGVGGTFALIYLRMRGRLKASGEAALASNRARFQAASEAFGGIKPIKAGRLESAFHARFLPASRDYSKHQTAHNLMRRVPYYVLQTVAFGGLTLLLMGLVASGRDLGYILPVVGIIAVGAFRLLPAFQQILASVVSFRFAEPLVAALVQEFQREKAEPLAAPSTAILEPQTSIQVDSVTFTYPGGERPVLRDLSFTIQPKTSVAFVGLTGAGKSTLLDLLLGIVRPDKGAILVDGRAVGEEDLSAWQRAIGYVPQEIYLVDDTIAANIAFGTPADQVDRAAVERAARLAQIHAFIERDLPAGYDTPVGERGVRLSGGQRQRIGIARALYGDPPVLILDEATSDVDNRTEAEITEALDALAGKKTLIVVAHRLATVRRCDEIMLLEQGRVVASGNFQTLVKNEPRFRDLANIEGEEGTMPKEIT